MSETLMKKIKEFLIKYEGLRLESYKDSAGKWTIGVGHLQKIQRKQTISLEYADKLLHQDILQRYDQLESIGIHDYYFNDNEYTAIFSLFYNIGIGNFKKANIYKDLLILQEKIELCPFSADIDFYENKVLEDFPRYVYCKGKYVDGLYKRRRAEMELYKTPSQYINKKVL